MNVEIQDIRAIEEMVEGSEILVVKTLPLLSLSTSPKPYS